MIAPLLQSTVPDDGLRRIAVMLLALLAIIVVGLIVVSRIRRRMNTEDGASELDAGFTLSDLRQMHKAGEVSDEEFAKAKERVVEAAKRAAERELKTGNRSHRDVGQDAG